MKIFVALVSFAAVLSACAGTAVAPRASTSSSSSTQGPSAAAASTAAGATAYTKVDVCSVMPLGDVQAKSPFQTALATAKPTVPAGGCTYNAALDAQDPVSVLIVVSGYELSVADAKTALANYRQAAVDRGLPVSDVAGLGDVAFAAGSDEVGVHALVRNLELDANFKGEWPDTTDDAKIAAGTELLRTLISRLP